MNIEQALVELLKAKGLGTLYYSTAPQDIVPPYRIAVRTGGQPLTDLSGRALLQQVTIRVANYGGTYLQSLSTADQLLAVLGDGIGQVWATGAPLVQDIVLTMAPVDTYDASLDVYGRELEFQFTFKEV